VAAGVGIGRYSLEVQVPPADVDARAPALNVGASVTYPVSTPVRVRGGISITRTAPLPTPANPVIVDDVPSAWRFVGAVTVRVGG
jgi:hypothetical protein